MHTDAPTKETLEGTNSLVHPLGDDASKRKKFLSLGCFAIVLATLMLLEFGGALNSYFTSDDLNHITYAYRMFANGGELFFRTFTTVWMQDSSTEIFYRPLIEVSFALDQLISGVNPLGYHISNFLYSYIGAFALLSISQCLAKRFDVPGGNTIGYVAALLFALSPLHIEVTTWLIGRVDGLSTMFYLVSFALFLRQKTPAALVSFFCAMLCKEMAASLPFVVFTFGVFISAENRLAGKLRDATRSSAPFFVVLALCFLIRFLATGAFLGGYVGAVAEANIFSLSTVLDRVAHFWKVAYPFNEDLVARSGMYETAFRVFYLLSGIFLAARIRFHRFGSGRLKLIGFLCSWLILQFLPLYQVFMLHKTLAGARLFYTSTAVFSMIIAVILVTKDPCRIESGSKRAFGVFASGLTAMLISLSVLVGMMNNQSWIIAAQHTEDMQVQINNAVAVLPADKKLLLVYAPIQMMGAYMFNRYYSVQSLLSPPLLNPDISSRVCTLEPRFYTYDHLIPSGKLRAKLADSTHYQPVYWDVEKWKLCQLESGKTFEISNASNVSPHSLPDLKLESGRFGMSEIIAARPFNTSDVRFIDVVLKNDKPVAGAKLDVIVLSFNRDEPPPKGIDNWVQANYDPSLPLQTVRFPVDEKLAWFLKSEMSEFGIYLREKPNLQVVSARLNSGANLIPSIAASPETLRECNDGLQRPIKFPLKFSFDVSNIPGATSCYCQLSRPRAMFQLENFTYRDSRPSKKALKNWSEVGTRGSVKLNAADFPDNACYQLRIFARKADGTVVGVSSDSIDIGINDRPKGQEL